jgi:hypothetical protein
MLLLEERLAPRDMQCALGQRKIGADQILVDLRELSLIRVLAIEDGAADRRPFEKTAGIATAISIGR